jgi:hypothetical protein
MIGVGVGGDKVVRLYSERFQLADDPIQNSGYPHFKKGGVPAARDQENIEKIIARDLDRSVNLHGKSIFRNIMAAHWVSFPVMQGVFLPYPDQTGYFIFYQHLSQILPPFNPWLDKKRPGVLG